MTSPVTKVPYDEYPHRCENISESRGQCKNIALNIGDGEYAPYCAPHNGYQAKNHKDKISLRNYRLNMAQWRSGVEHKINSSGIKDLREEIGILRILLEEKLNRCTDSTDLMLQSGPIGDMIMKIERVVSSCHKLEGSMGSLLDKQAILQFSQVVISIITQNVTDDAQISLVADQILVAVGAIGNE